MPGSIRARTFIRFSIYPNNESATGHYTHAEIAIRPASRVILWHAGSVDSTRPRTVALGQAGSLPHQATYPNGLFPGMLSAGKIRSTMGPYFGRFEIRMPPLSGYIHQLGMDDLPRKTVIDGIDQTSLLLLGEGHGRRHFMFHYSGGTLGAVRYKDYKVHLHAAHGGLPGMDIYNIMRDPGEKFGKMYNYLFAVTPVQNLMKSHIQMINKYPNRVSETMPKGAGITPHD